MTGLHDATTTLAAHEAAAETCQRILQAAEAVFLEHGFHATTMDMIARQAGCAKKTIYKLFSSKETLFGTLLHRVRSRVRSIELVPDCPPEETLQAFLLAMGKVILDDSSVALTRMAIAEGGRSLMMPPFGPVERSRSPQLRLESYLARLQATGAYDFGPLDQATRLLIGMALGAFHHEILLGLIPEVDEDALTRRVARAVRIFLKGCSRA
jgi:AcrR family transcriptional regulator